MRISPLLGLVVLAGTLGHARECTQRGEPAVKVLVQNAVIVPAYLLSRAEMTASRIFDIAGVRLRFHNGSTFRRSSCDTGVVIEIRLDSQAPDNRSPGVLAYAKMSETAGTRVHVFYDRVRAINQGSMTATLLGHVLAHEVAHVLQGVSRHSERGLLKARWNELDYAAMMSGPLQMTSEDAGLLRAALTSAAD